MDTTTRTTVTAAVPSQRSPESTETDRAERFMTAWKHLEQELTHRWLAAHEGVGHVARPEIGSVLRWAQHHRLLTPEGEAFLDRCRVARNAYAHVAFNGYVGPVTIPPEPVVVRVERLAQTLSNPALVGTVAVDAVTCLADTTLGEAVRIMHQHDFSQLPYQHPTLGWLLVTRDQVGRWVEVHMEDDGTVIADLGVAVRTLADDERVGPVRPVTVSAGTPVARVVEHLEHALITRDCEPGGYAVVLIAPKKGKPCRLVAGEDLPNLYDVLGR